MGLEFISAGMYQHRPRIDTLTFAGVLKKEDMLEPQVLEYTYTGEETKDINPTSHKTEVQIWELIYNPNPFFEIKFLEKEGNYVKVQFKLLKEEAWSPNTSDPNVMNLRIILHAHMGDIDLPNVSDDYEVLDKYVTSETSNVYHKADCSYAKRIKNKSSDITKKKCSRCM